MRFFRASGGIFALALAAIGASIMYETIVNGATLSTGNFLLGALCCSLALMLFFIIVQPSPK
jgi:hypothetical protein